MTYVQIFNYKSFVTGFNLNFVTDFFNQNPVNSQILS